MIKRVLVGIVLSVLTLSPAFAEIMHYAEFGECAVWSEIDEFTDVATAHALSCNYNQIGLVCYPTPESELYWRAFIVAKFDSVETTVRAQFRFDQQQAYDGTWLNNSTDEISAAVAPDYDVVKEIFSGLESAQSFVYKLGYGPVNSFDLTRTDGHGAVEELKSRCTPETEAPVDNV